MKTILKATFLLCFINISLNCFAIRKNYYTKDFGIKPNSKTTINNKLNQMLMDIKAEKLVGDSIYIHFEKGIYHFDSKQALRKELYISNHDQVKIHPTALLVEDFDNLFIDGNGAEFICSGRLLPMAFINCNNLSIKNLSIDFDNPMMAQLEIIENNEKGIRFKPAKWVKWALDNKNDFYFYGKDWQCKPWYALAFDKKTHHVLYNTADIIINVKDVIDNGDGSLSAPHWNDKTLTIGTQVIARTEDKQNPAIFIDNSQDIDITSVNVYYAQAMALLVQNSKDIHLDKFNVCIRNNSDRYFTSQADAAHFSGCKGKIVVENGLYEAMMDDALNVHGLYLIIDKVTDKNSFIASYRHPQSWGFSWAKANDEIQFIDSHSFNSIGSKYSIKEIKAIDRKDSFGAKSFKISLNEDIDSLHLENYSKIGIENLSRCAEVIYKNNIIRNNRARGILLNTPKKIIIENNLFSHISGSAILCSTDCNNWFESGQTQELYIINNQFIDLLTTDRFQFTEAVISLYPIIPNIEKQLRPFYGSSNTKKGIVIKNNLFQTFDTPLLSAISTDGISWLNNTIIETKTYPKFHHNQLRFNFQYCGKNITIKP